MRKQMQTAMQNDAIAMLRTDGRTYGRSTHLQETSHVPERVREIDEIEVTREDLLRTRVVLAQLQGEQERLSAELDATGLTEFVDRADWLIARRTTDEQLACQRHWRRLGLPVPEPRRERRPRSRRLSTAELLDELDWLLGNGATPWEAADALGSSRTTISKLAYRHHRPDLGTRMQVPWAERAA